MLSFFFDAVSGALSFVDGVFDSFSGFVAGVGGFLGGIFGAISRPFKTGFGGLRSLFGSKPTEGPGS